jgi:transcriptional regulator with XRE-family HTH domain
MSRMYASIRTRLGLSSRQMAAALQISHSLYAMAEKGRRSLPPDRIHFLVALLPLLECAASDSFASEKQTVIDRLSLQLQDQLEENRFRQARKKAKGEGPCLLVSLPDSLPGHDPETQPPFAETFLETVRTFQAVWRHRYPARYQSTLELELEAVQLQAGLAFLAQKNRELESGDSFPEG